MNKTIVASLIAVCISPAWSTELGDVKTFLLEARNSPAPSLPTAKAIGASKSAPTLSSGLLDGLRPPIKLTLPSGAVEGHWNGYSVQLAPDGQGGIQGHWNGYRVDLTPDGQDGVEGHWNGYRVSLSPDGQGGVEGNWNGYRVNLSPDGQDGVEGNWNGYRVNLTPAGQDAVYGHWNGNSVNLSLTDAAPGDWLSNPVFTLALFSPKK